MLTKKQKQVLDYITSYRKKRGYSPALEEIRKHFGLASVSTAHFHVKSLQDLGFLDKQNNRPRSIDINKSEKMVQIPLIGTIAAGVPIEAIQQKELMVMPKSKLPRTGNVYALRVVGNSMVDENINNGDIILVKQQSVAENGQKVVALIDNYEATLKKFYKEKDHIRLQPANKSLEPIIINGKRNIIIQGIVLDVIQNQNEAVTKENDYNLKKKASIPENANPTGRKLINNLNDLSAREWIPETISVFTQKGLGSGHKDTVIEKQHPAPFSFQDVGRLIRFFTKKGQLVLDPFCGVGSTLKACAVNDRRGIGIEIVKKYADLTKERLKVELRDDLFGTVNKEQKVIYGDALAVINQFKDNLFDFIVTSPPYWNILAKVDHKVKQERISKNLDIKYSELKKDLGNISDYTEFLNILARFFNDCARILKPKKYMAIIVSDFRHKEKFYTFHSDLAVMLERENFALKGITILYQKFKKIFPYGYPYSYVSNIHHQYILIFQNRKGESKKIC